MKKIVVTQRVDEILNYDERRDTLDQKWVEFLLSADLFPVIAPNNIIYTKQLLSTENIDGVLLTGGNSLVKYGGNAPERDIVETFLLEWAIKHDKPCLGVCRGMQLIQDYFKITLAPVPNHIATRHHLIVKDGHRLTHSLNKLSDVNSYHDYGTTTDSKELLSVATSLDGVVMAVEHCDNNVFGVMWHSERERPFVKSEIEIFELVYNRK